MQIKIFIQVMSCRDLLKVDQIAYSHTVVIFTANAVQQNKAVDLRKSIFKMIPITYLSTAD